MEVEPALSCEEGDSKTGRLEEHDSHISRGVSAGHDVGSESNPVALGSKASFMDRHGVHRRILIGGDKTDRLRHDCNQLHSSRPSAQTASRNVRST